MCCATKNVLISVILWLLALIGIAPVTPGWVDTVEQWIGYEQALHPAIYTYASTESQDLRAFIFTVKDADDSLGRPAVVISCCPSGSQSLPEEVLGICLDLARMGYVAIGFEFPFDNGEDIDPLLPVAWLTEHDNELGVDLSRTAGIEIVGQPALGFRFEWNIELQERGVDQGLIVVPEGLHTFPSELVLRLPVLQKPVGGD